MHTYSYIHIYIFISISAHVCMHVCIYIFIYLHDHIYVNIYMYSSLSITLIFLKMFIMLTIFITWRHIWFRPYSCAFLVCLHIHTCTCHIYTCHVVSSVAFWFMFSATALRVVFETASHKGVSSKHIRGQTLIDLYNYSGAYLRQEVQDYKEAGWQVTILWKGACTSPYFW